MKLFGKYFSLILALCFVLIVNCHKVHDVENEILGQPPQHHQQQHQQQQQQHHQQPQHQQQQQHHQQPQNLPTHDEAVNAMHINKEHVLEHLDGVINKPKDQMTVDEQNFYYFKLHDYDNNNVLDGLELVTAFAHNLNEEHNHNSNENNSSNAQQPPASTPAPIPRIADDELMRLIDGIMLDEDKDNNGYITYQEFLRAVKGS